MPEARMSEWRDIGSAPKDKTAVFIACRNPVRPGEWVLGEAYYDPEAYDGTWWWAGTAKGDYYADPVEEGCSPPVYWQPLPLPPA